MEEQILVDRKFMELVYAVASHFRYTEKVDADGRPYANMILHVKGSPQTADVYYGDEYKPGSDLYVDMLAAVRYLERMQKEQTDAAQQVKRKARGRA